MKEDEDHPYVLSELVNKEDLDWSKIHLGVLDEQICHEMQYVSNARSIEAAMPAGIDTLAQLFYKYWKEIPMECKNAILDENKDSDIHKAYLMGKIAMAQQFSSNIIARLPQERAYDILDDEANQKYFELLIESDQISIKNTSEKTGEDEEKVRSLFSEMTQLGLCDFRSDGIERVYFLTPFAKGYYKSSKKGS